MFVITGGSRGIGAAVARTLVNRGESVLVHGGHDSSQLRHCVEELRSLATHTDQQIEGTLADFRDPTTIEPFCQMAWKLCGNVRGLVVCAGSDILTHGAAKWPFEQRLHALLDVDVCATTQIARWFGEQFRNVCEIAKNIEDDDCAKVLETRSIVLIGWSGVDRGVAGDGGELFGIAKGAIHGFARSLARTLAPWVRVNVVAPGWIRTDWGNQADLTWQERVRHGTALERWGCPEEVATLIGFLLSPESAYLNGTIIPVDGMTID